MTEVPEHLRKRAEEARSQGRCGQGCRRRPGRGPAEELSAEQQEACVEDPGAPARAPKAAKAKAAGGDAGGAATGTAVATAPTAAAPAAASGARCPPDLVATRSAC